MRAPMSWIRDYIDLPVELTVDDLTAELTALGLKLEALERPGSDMAGSARHRSCAHDEP